MNEIQEIAQRRLEAIENCTARIKAKQDRFSKDDPRQAGWADRLAEYEVSKTALALELKSGVAVKIKDPKQMALVAAMTDGDSVPRPSKGTTVDVPAGNVKLEGK